MKDEILFIDDEECIRQVAARMLEKDDFHVTTLGSGDGALDAVAKKKPVLVFLDIKMPGKDGLDVLKEIKAAAPEVPVVMVSGHMNSDYAVQASKAGACDYILKPVDWRYLRNIAHMYSSLAKARPHLEPVSLS
jgi:two-component system, NtrC family, nitrogen regulation response regulator NtrX